MRPDARGTLRCFCGSFAIAIMVAACGDAGSASTLPGRAEVNGPPKPGDPRAGAMANNIYNGPVAFTVVAEGLSATFFDHSSDDVGSQQWVFGDGATSTAASPLHAYSREGTYNVTETIINAAGQASVRTIPVSVIPLPPAL